MTMNWTPVCVYIGSFGMFGKEHGVSDLSMVLRYLVL